MTPDLWRALIGGLLIGLHERTGCLRHRQLVATVAPGDGDLHDERNPRRVSRAAWIPDMAFLTALIAGLPFGAGLLLSRMCDPERDFRARFRTLWHLPGARLLISTAGSAQAWVFAAGYGRGAPR